jgi:hypothetical protein
LNVQQPKVDSIFQKKNTHREEKTQSWKEQKKECAYRMF